MQHGHWSDLRLKGCHTDHTSFPLFTTSQYPHEAPGWISISYLFLCIWLHLFLYSSVGLSGSSAGKESACNAGDPGSIPESERTPWKGIGYPFQYSWASLMVQMVKNPPAMWETWVQSLSHEDPLEEEMATHSSILAWRIPWTEEAGGLQCVGSQSRTRLSVSVMELLRY